MENVPTFLRTYPVIGVHLFTAAGALPCAAVDKHVNVTVMLEVGLHRLEPLLCIGITTANTA
jgi:hypothetical protein